MILMMVCAVGTEFDLHAYMVSKPPDENLQPSAAGFHPRANARRPQPDFWIDGLDRPSALEFIGNTAYFVTLTGEIWKIDGVCCRP